MIAGTLDLLLEQDGNLPEDSIKKFGIDICQGLFEIHSQGILFCDLIPRKLMIDGDGSLKLSDFGLSKIESEDLEQIFIDTYEQTDTNKDNTNNKVYKKPFGDVNYMAPEILLNDSDNTKESDLWSLGCILYKMYTGTLPFSTNEDNNLQQLKHAMLTKELPHPKGNKLSIKPSNDFWNLLKGLLEKDPSKRLVSF
jgi:serine/threonine-protein kinase ULK4